jgi:hypothetical protein
MSKVVIVAVGLIGLGATKTPAGDPPSVPVDFKILIASFTLKPEPTLTEEVIVRQGRAYVFPSDSKEVVVIEPVPGRIELVDVGRKIKAEVTFRTLDDSIVKLKAKLTESADSREKLGGRGNLLEARMTRDLFQTKLTIADGPEPNHIRLTNPAIEVDARGEPDPDALRRTSIGLILSAIARLGAYRSPGDLPPFAELEAIHSLTTTNTFRPTELSYLYRLNGPPRKFRRTYRVVPSLTNREVEAISRVDAFRKTIPEVRYGQYKVPR